MALEAKVALRNDEDLDGVVDTIEPEACLNTEFGLEVDTNGCADNQLDDDNDGVNNHIDLCSDTIQSLQESMVMAAVKNNEPRILTMIQ